MFISPSECLVECGSGGCRRNKSKQYALIDVGRTGILQVLRLASLYIDKRKQAALISQTSAYCIKQRHNICPCLVVPTKKKEKKKKAYHYLYLFNCYLYYIVI